MKDFYTFPAIFHVADDGISISFPDLPGCLPCADTMEEAFGNAREALQLHLYGMEENGESIPDASPVANIHAGTNETMAMIEAWMPPFRERMDDVNNHRNMSRKFSSVDELTEDLNA